MLHFDFRCTVPRVYYHLESTNQRICHFLALHTRDANAIIDLSRKTTIARFFYISPLTFRRRLIRYEVANERYDRSSANRFHFLRVATTSRERGSVRTGVRFGCTTSNVGQSVTKSPAKSRRGTRLRFCERFNLTHTRARARHYAFGAASRKLSACYDSRARARPPLGYRVCYAPSARRWPSAASALQYRTSTRGILIWVPAATLVTAAATVAAMTEELSLSLFALLFSALNRQIRNLAASLEFPVFAPSSFS